MSGRAKRPLVAVPSVLFVIAVLLACVGSAGDVWAAPPYRGDAYSVHAIFDWVSYAQAGWDRTLFASVGGAYDLHSTEPSAWDDGTDTTIQLPNFVDPLSQKLMRIQLFFDGPVPGELISMEVVGYDPEGAVVNQVGGSGLEAANYHYRDFEILPNPDWEQITIYGDTGSNILPGNLLRVEIDTVSLPEPATVGLLAMGGVLICSDRLKRRNK